MKKRIFSKQILILLSILVLIAVAAFAMFAGKTEEDFEMKPKEFATRFNEGVAELNPGTYSNLKIASMAKTGVNYVMNHAPKEHYLYSQNMTAQIACTTCYKNNITCMTFTAAPYDTIDPMSNAYLTEWSDAAALMLTSLFRDMTDAQARAILHNNLGLPAAASDEIDWDRLAAGKKVSIDLGGLKCTFSGSMTEKGDVKVTVDLLFTSDSVVVLASSATSSSGDTYYERPIKVDVSKTTTVKLGQQFQIDLVANSGVEHKWKYSTSGSGGSRLIENEIYSPTGELGGEPRTPSKIKPPTTVDSTCDSLPVGDRTGSAQYDTFVFQATRTGTQEFTFEYWYPADGKRVITKIVQFTVEIER